jgi:hypothetical protein
MNAGRDRLAEMAQPELLRYLDEKVADGVAEWVREGTVFAVITDNNTLVVVYEDDFEVAYEVEEALA